MGIWKIDSVSSEEWHRRQMRRHSIRMWLITLAEIAAMVGIVLLMMWAIRIMSSL